MAYYINPDGTVSYAEVEYNSSGDLVPKKDYSNSEKTTKRDLYGISTNKQEQNVKVKKTCRRERISKERRNRINQFIAEKKKAKQLITYKEFVHLYSQLDEVDSHYFIDVCAEYKEYCIKQGWASPHSNTTLPVVWAPHGQKNRKTINKKQPKATLTKSEKRSLLNEVDDLEERISQMSNLLKTESKKRSSSGHSLGDIAKFSSLKKTTPDSDYIQGRAVNGASRQPKYGYARDRYGRVQERDRLNEDRYNEFSQAQNHNKNYDYSDYDSNDDHDGAYSGWE